MIEELKNWFFILLVIVLFGFIVASAMVITVFLFSYLMTIL